MKVLIISTVGLKYEGITSVIVSSLKAMNRDNLDIYVAGTIEVHPSIRKELEKINCKVIDFPSRKVETVKYFFSLIRFIHKNRIDVVHAHGNSATLSIDLLAAWIGGCKKRIAHSHNTKCDQAKADKILHPLFDNLYTDALACGNNAGEWLFGHKPFDIITNGRDIETFKFNESIRLRIRKEFNLEGKIVIGHVGGFIEQKNHSFLVDVFKSIHSINPDTYLFLIGDGKLRGDIEEKVRKFNLIDYVYFAGVTNRVADLLQGMDGMLLPSKFEGLPLVAIEWQISGLPCVLSDVITKECKCTDMVSFCSLEQGPEKWASTILTLINQNNRTENSTKNVTSIRKAGFDIKSSAEHLKNIYLA